MRVRSSLALAAVAALLVVACQGSSGAGLKIGVATDVGTVNDKNFNEYSYKGAADGAAAVGAPNADNLPYVVPNSSADYAPDLQHFIDGGFNVIVGVGFAQTNEVAAAAKANPNIWFIGVDHAPCINASGDVDTTFTDCSGSIASLLPKYIALNYQEDQAGYLAGMVAASASKSGVIGAIGGVSLCAPCVRYIQGYVLGAKSVNPNITVKVAWVSDSDFVKGFADQAAGTTFANQFLQQNPQVDVLFQVAGLTGNGVIDAACSANINAIGVDVDQHESYPASQACILTSAEKHLAVSVRDSIKAIADGTAKGGLTYYNASNDGIGVSPFYDAASKLPSDMQSKIDAAIAGMKDGSITTCPAAPECGKVPAPPIGD
jgi:basic membrane protein A